MENNMTCTSGETRKTSEKSFVVTLLLAALPMTNGLHRIYVGKVISGFFLSMVVSLPAERMAVIDPTGGLALMAWIWKMVDVIYICMQKFKDRKGATIRAPRPEGVEVSECSLTATFLFLAFLGWLGMHRFYIGRAKQWFKILGIVLLVSIVPLIAIVLMCEDALLAFKAWGMLLLAGVAVTFAILWLKDLFDLVALELKDSKGRLILPKDR